MNQDLDILLRFVEGNIDALKFEKELYASKTMEEYLSNDPNLPLRNLVGGDTYLYLISGNYRSVSHLWNVQNAIESFLERKNIGFKSTDMYAQLSKLFLAAQPKWLDVDSGFITRNYLPKIEGLSSVESRLKLKELFLNDFQYLKKPPNWIQNPDWPIEGDEPLVFMGQIDTTTYFHDTGSIYLFHCRSKNTYTTIVQTM